MADKFLWEKESPNPTSDVENPPVSIDSNASDVCHEDTSCSTPKAVKVGLGLVALAGTIALGVVLGLNGSKDEPIAKQVASSASAVTHTAVQGAVESKSHTVESTNDNNAYPESLDERIKKTSLSTTQKYDTCDDLENDIIEALKLYMADYITDEAVTNEVYASCDPDNDNWWWDVYGYDDYVYHHHYNVDYICSPEVNNTDSCITEEKDVPWVLTWHEWDHAEGKLFYNKDEALEAYENVNASFAKRLYCPYKMKVEEYGWMGGHDWCELETWAYEAQCSGEAPTTPSAKHVAKSNVPRPKSSEKQRRSHTSRDHLTSKHTRSNIPVGLKQQTRSNIPSVRQGNGKDDKSRTNKSGGTQNSVDQNSQNENVDETDKVVSDGSFIYAAYGDVLYAWPADGDMNEASITHMPGEANECDWNTTQPCTTISKPNIQALFLGKDNSRLTVVVSQSFYDQYTSTDQIPPLVTDYGSELDVRVYDVSEVTPGSPLNELGHKSLSGSWLDGGSVSDKTVIATSSFINTYELTKDLARSQPQYCGLNTTSYKELAASTAESKVELLAKQMVEEFDLLHGCSEIVKVSTLLDASDPNLDVLDLTGADFLFGNFIQIFSLDTSLDFNADETIPSSVAGSFRPGYGYSMYMSEDFLALPSEIYKYNSTASTSSYETFIIGFDLSTGVAPVCYGHLPGQFEGSKHRMDKTDHEFRILTSQWSMDPESWASIYTTKIFTLSIPSRYGRMELLSESEIFLDEGFFAAAILFSRDKTYLVADDWNYENKKKFIVVDMVGQMNPKVVGSLEIDNSVSYIHEININGTPYILCIGTMMDTSTWESSMTLTLIDVGTPSLPKETTFYKEKPGIASDIYDFLTLRYLNDSNKLILPFSSTNYTDFMTTYNEGFSVYDISETTISYAFNVTHSTNEHYCWYDAKIPPRSLVIQSELITIRDHSAIKSDLETGSFLTELDLDIGFNYSICDDWYYYYAYDYSHEYDDDDDGTDNFMKV